MSTISAGTTSTTALVSSGDTTGNLVFQTNGTTTAMTINTSQNVGIGVASPGYPLDVQASSNSVAARIRGRASDNLSAILFDSNAAANYAYIQGGPTFLAFATGNTERMRIDSSGNVGIGSGAPALKLAVKTSDTAAIGYFGGTTYATRLGANANTATVEGVDAATGTSSYQPLQVGGSILTLATGGSERMRIDASGNVGIGTSSPGHKLEVSGVAKLADSFYGYGNLELGSYGTGDRYCYIDFHSSGTPNSIDHSARILRQPGANGSFDISNLGTGSLIFATNSAERARITSGGEVYIAGTTDQGAYNLQCNGTGVWGAGAYVNGSDARLKENIQTLTDGLSVVTQLRPVTFQYKADYSKDTSVQPGFIAQELQAVLQGKDYVDGVVQAGPEHLNVAYQTLIPVLTKAIQEQQTIIEDLRARIAVLEAK